MVDRSGESVGDDVGDVDGLGDIVGDGDGVGVSVGDGIGDGVVDGMGDNVEDIVDEVVGIDALSLFLKSVASNCSFASQINLILQSGGAADLNCSNVCLL